jgi:putative hydrolase of HD superfamily
MSDVRDPDRRRPFAHDIAQDIQTLHPFFSGSIPHLEHPVIQKWAETLMAERRQLWASRGREAEEREGLNGCSVGSSLRQTNGH